MDVPANAVAVTQLFKLNVDCFEHLFEYFSLKELLTFRRTCKRIKAVVDYYIKLNYPRLLRLCIKNRQTLMELRHTRLDYFEWIRHLYIWTTQLNNTQIDGIEYILNQLETLKLCWVQIDGDFYEVVLKYCPRLKYLGVRTDTVPQTIIGTGNEWLLRQYPSLDHFEIEIRTSSEQPLQYGTELLEFFVRNPNIRIFSTNSAFLLMSREVMLRSNIKLDRLDIYINRTLNSIYSLTNELYKLQFFKHLHLYSCQDEEFYRNQDQYLWSLSNLEKVDLYSLPDDFQIPVVGSVKKLSIHMCSLFPLDFPKLMATNFINLSQIEIQYARINDIWPFIRIALKLKEIKIWKLLTDDVEEPRFSDFVALNEEREKLALSRKVTIYIDETSFLKMKWTAALRFSSIELKQIESCGLDQIGWI